MTVTRGRRTRGGVLLVLAALLASCSSPPPDSPRPDSPRPEPRPHNSPTEEGRWLPKPGVEWQWQLTGTLDRDVDVPVYDIDGFNHDAAVVRGLHKRGVKVICYLNVGAWEDWRPDADDFPAALLGKGNGWEGERWLDIRQTKTLRPLLAKRFDMCADKGFDAIEPDQLDGHINDTGFPLTAQHQLDFNRMVSRLARERGLSVGLKNDVDHVRQLLDDFDFAVNEECAAFDECAKLSPFIEAGKAVFHVEYELKAAEFCPRTRALGFSSMAKRPHLDAWRESCGPGTVPPRASPD